MGLEFYEIEKDYTDFLREVDQRVPLEKNYSGAKTRKYIGVVLTINEYKYFTPLSSPKPKFRKMRNGKDFLKIDGGRLGAINFNNMIPVVDDALIDYDIDNEPDKQYQYLVKDQARFIRKNKEKIYKKANILYEIMTGNKTEDENERKRLKNRCYDFKVLEEQSKQYKG